MAAVSKRKFMREEVLNQNMFNTDSVEQPSDCLNNVKEALGCFAREKGCQNVGIFVNACAEQIIATLDACCSNNVNMLTTAPISPAPIIQREARLRLSAVRRRIGGKRSIRSPYYREISRDMPVEIFSVIRRIVRGSAGFVEPFCFQNENKKAIVISLTSMRLVNELFVLLSGMSKDVVAGYFKQSLGSRKGHTAAVIVSDVKDFAIIYKKRCGKLVIGFNYGGWNVNGFLSMLAR